MKKDHLAFLLGGLAFGILVGFGLFRTMATRPAADEVPARGGAPPSVAGPPAPTGTGSGGPEAGSAPSAQGQGGAPMMAEINGLKERVQKNPKDIEAWTRLGNLYQDAGMSQPAIGFYEKAAALDPNNAAVLTDMGICYQQQNDFDKALALFEKAQKADPSNWQSLYNIVVVAGLGMKEFDKADAALAKLVQLKPDAPKLDDLRSALENARHSSR